MRIIEKDDVSDKDALSNTKFLLTELENISNCLEPNKTNREKTSVPLIFSNHLRQKSTSKSSIFESEHGMMRRPSKAESLGDVRKGTNFVFQLKEIMHKQKVKSIVNNFKEKIKRNNCESQPVSYDPYEIEYENSILKKNGVNLGNWVSMSLALVSVLQIILLSIVYSLSLVFPEVRRNDPIQNFSIFSLIFFFVQILLNFITIKEKDGKKIITLKNIIKCYLEGRFIIDFLCFVILAIDLAGEFEVIKYLRLCILFKVGGCLDKLDLLQSQLINSFYKEQYWGLAKVFLLNFFFAHILSVCLLGMSELTAKNWLSKIGAKNAPWYEQYAWSYYWGTTIMLTVGFGDLSATNYQEAICLTLIQTFSCIALAYNINCVGTLISNIRSQEIQKNRKLKIINHLATRNSLPEELLWKINNYIEETTKMKKIFNIEEEKEFISGLPSGLKTNFLKESNKNIFQNLSFFSNFTERTLINLAEKLEMFVSYPEEIIFNNEKASTILILREGKIGFCTKQPASEFNETIVNELDIKNSSSPSLLSLDFIFKRPINYELKSLNYSLLYQIDYLVLKEIVKLSKLDFQNFCMMVDRSNHILDEYEFLECSECKTKHSRMRCPRIHFIPIKQHVINKYLTMVKKTKNKREAFARIFFPKYQPMKLYHKNRELYRMFEDKKNQSKKARKSQLIKTAKLSELLKSEDEISFQQKSLQQFEFYLNEIMENVKAISNKETHCSQDFWDVECDELYDFKFYFSNENAKTLNEKYTGKEWFS